MTDCTIMEIDRLERENKRLRQAVQQVLNDIGDRLTGKTVLLLRAALVSEKPKAKEGAE